MNRKDKNMLKQEQNKIDQKKIAAVDKLVGTEKKMNKADKLLYYENYLSTDNKFRGVIQFPNIFFSLWLNYLVCDKDSYDTFMNLFYKKSDIYGAIMKFRRHLLNHEHRGQNVKLSTIQQLTINNDYIHLKETLQELFLEPIGDGNINELVQLINKGKLNIVELLVWHREFPEYRLVTLIERYK